MAEQFNSAEGGAHINTACHRATVIGSTTPARRRSDAEWVDTIVSSRFPEELEQQQGDAMASFVVCVIGLAGVLGLLALCWWAGHGGKWVPLW